MSEAKSKGKGTNNSKPFADELTGIIQTVNLFKDESEQVTGTRGQMNLSEKSIELIKGLGFALESDRVIYKITQEKLGIWEGENAFQRGDKISFGSAHITTYKGKIVDWKGLLYTSLCRSGFVKVVTGERKTSGKFKPKVYRNPLKTEAKEKPETRQPAKASIATNDRLFETLTTGIEQAEEALSELKKIVSAGEILAIPEREFHHHSTKVSLAYHRMFSTILIILERE